MKRISILVLALLVACQTLLFSLSPTIVVAGTTKTVKVVYYRFDQQYDTWNLWMWPKEGDGGAYEFTKETELDSLPGRKVMVAEIDTSGFNADEAGIIVRKGNWEQKDVDNDRFFSLNKPDSNGVTTIYLVQGISAISFSEEEAAPYYNPSIDSAEFMDLNTIRVYLQAPAEALGGDEGFKLLHNDKEVKFSQVIRGVDGMGFVIKTAENIDISQNYILTKDKFGDSHISKERLYNTDDFNDKFFYDGDDLGATYTKEQTVFKLWAPTAAKVSLSLFDDGLEGAAYKEVSMDKSDKGVWTTTVKGDLKGKYFTYQVDVNGTTNEAVDPYATAVGVNGRRAMVIDLSETNPEGWDDVGYVELKSYTDAIIYEMHVRDTTISDSSGVNNKGKYLGMGEVDTKSPESGVLTGLSHVKELGATHIHLLPVFDYNSVNETKLDQPQFNWGYDPRNYNAPEGSYATDPYDGTVRVTEFKEMVKSIKEQGIGVVMDVVYNHTALSADSDFSKIVPGYYYRMADGNKFSNGSGCGNETASERMMVRKFIVDSVCYWAKEYKIDGFRFDLMGLHDIETMNAVTKALKEINPSILVYGEGWTAGGTPLPQGTQAIKANISKAPDVAVFNDSTRDGVKGHVFTDTKPGFVGGDFSLKESIKFGIVGAVSHSGVNYAEVNYDTAAYALTPSQCVNYISAHDNLTLYDKLKISTPDRTEEDYKNMTKIGGAIVLTSQGVPFMLSGTDFMRTKGGDGNSYKSPDSVNAIDWEYKNTNQDMFKYYQGLIALRKAHPAFRMNDTEAVNANLKFIDDTADNLIAYTIDNHANNDSWKTIFVAFNAGDKEETVTLALNTDWNIVVDSDKAGVETLSTVNGNTIKVPAMSSLVAYDSKTVVEVVEPETSAEPNDDVQTPANSEQSSNLLKTIFPIAAAAIVLVVLVVVLIQKKKK